jgi:hypothetical protein
MRLDVVQSSGFVKEVRNLELSQVEHESLKLEWNYKRISVGFFVVVVDLFSVLGIIELRASCLLGRLSTT